MTQSLESLKGMIGFADWHLADGKTVQEVFAMMERKREFGGVPPDYFVKAIDMALTNIRLCEACNQKIGKITAEDHEQWQAGEAAGRKVTVRDLLARLGNRSDYASSSEDNLTQGGQPSQPSQ